MAITTSTHHALVSPREGRPSVLSNAYGWFEGRDFVIKNVLTPRPWINVLANDEYGLVVSQSGGGFSWFGNCQLFRLNRWEQDLATDRLGRFLYVADLETGEVWSTTYQPTRVKASFEEARYGLGYTRFVREVSEIRTSHTVFVPRDNPCEVWLLEVANLSDRERTLRLGGCLEWHLGGAGETHHEFQRLFVSTQVEGDTLLAWKRRGLRENERRLPEEDPTAFVQCLGLGEPIWFTDKAAWLGREGDPARPEGMVTDCRPELTGRWDDPVAAFAAPLTLAPGETKSVAICVGAKHGREEARALAQSLASADLDQLFTKTTESIDAFCGALQIRSDDPLLELMCDAWLPYQAQVGRMQARCAYYQQGGAFGYRDQLQDSLVRLDDDPAVTLRQISLHAEAMYEDGGVRHWWHPGTDIFSESRHSDTCLWLAFATLEYLDETADLAALETQLDYLGRSCQAPSSRGSLLDHCCRGMNRALELRSKRGLPLILAGDWNDGLSHAGLDGKGESVWLAMFLYHVLLRWEPYLRRTGHTDQADTFKSEADALRNAVEDHAWDGEWYLAGTRDDGRPFGSRTCAEGQIFLNPQTWAVISGIASPERASRAMAAAQERLIKPYGALLLAPAYTEVDPMIGYITRYAPGLRENGGVYSHASAWAVQALAMSGQLDSAWELWRGMCPPVRASEDADLYAAEPYVMPGNADGPDSPFESRAGWTWYTGSAAWMRRVAVSWLLGVRATYEGLEVRGTVPRALGSVRLNRPFRGEVRELVLGP